MSDFFSAFFCCTRGEDVLKEEEEDKRKLQEEEEHIQSLSDTKLKKSFSYHSALNLLPSIIPMNYLFEKEKEVLNTLTQETIIDFFNSLQEKDRGIHLYKSDLLNLYANKEGSPISSDFYLCTTHYTIKKSELYKNCPNKQLSLEELSNLYNIPEIRKKWDKGIFDFKIIIQLETKNPNVKAKIRHITFNSPVTGVDKREMVDKIITFYDNGKFYAYQSSIDEELGKNLVELKSDVVRAFTLVNVSRMTEDEDNIHMVSYYQTDFRVNLKFLTILDFPS